MTPKEKAFELYEAFFYSIPSFTDEGQLEHKTAKQCTLIAVDEILNTVNNLFNTYSQNDYWLQVKQEIDQI